MDNNIIPLVEGDGVNICPICAESHLLENCSYITVGDHITDKEIPSKARLTLPDFLKVEKLADGTNSVVTKKDIPKGTKFGPLVAIKTFTLVPSVMFSLKIFPSKGEDFLEYYLDTTDETKCNWMIFIAAAGNLEEQNILCYQADDSIYYVTTKDICCNEHLRVWYSPYYAMRMKKTFLTDKPSSPCTNIDVNALIKGQQKVLQRDIWTCKFCGAVKTDTAVFAEHILEHYILQLKMKCEICKSSFNSRKRFKKHMNLAHSEKSILNEVKHQQSVKYEQKEKEISMGGPLLNNILTDSLDNSNFLPDMAFDMNIEHQNMLIDTENLNVENLLSENVKQLDHFNFDIGEPKEEFICDICLKNFSKIRYLVQHLKRHTPKFMCKICLKIFCRNESLKYHICCRSYNHKCTVCDKCFLQQKYLKRHYIAIHDKKFFCEQCNKSYCSNSELKTHNCAGVPDQCKTKFSCTMCNKSFLRNAYLKKHMAVHDSISKLKAPKTMSQFTVCPICAKSVTKSGYYIHMKSHQEKNLECTVCNRKFNRKDLLEEHMHTHSHGDLEKSFECPTCRKKFISKKILRMHQAIHVKKEAHKCIKCNATFSQRFNLLKHMKKHDNNPDYLNVSTIDFYSCEICGKKIKLRSSLSRHMKNKHPHEKLTIPKPQKIDIKSSNNREEGKSVAKVDEDTIEVDIINGDIDEIDNMKIIENILDNTTKEMGIGDFVNLNPLEVLSSEILPSEERKFSLSMPDLSEGDHSITLGDDAYILENGTIIEPQGTSDNVVVYVLDQLTT